MPSPGEAFSESERVTLVRHFTRLDGETFALVGLPEAVKGALFARYSRSGKSLRRLFLDEFLEAGDAGALPEAAGPGTARAERLYERVFVEYGDDSVAQLGGAHLACEGVSNLVTKALEWGRLMAYLEQSTRYVPYDDRPGGRWRYHVPVELDGPLRARFVETLDRQFETYAAWLPRLTAHLAASHPRAPGDSEAVHRAAVRAKALDALRGLLPAATVSNVGLYGSGQAFEQLLLRLAAHPLAEARERGRQMLGELRKVIPAFLGRVDRADRGGAWSAYLAATRDATRAEADRILGAAPLAASAAAEPTRTASGDGEVSGVELTDFDPDGEVKVAAAALYAGSDLPDRELLARARRMTAAERAAVLAAYVGERANRRHRPGRAFERTSYRFDVLADYGAFRDLQRHRLLTLEWQRLTPDHGQAIPEAVVDAGGESDWRGVMDRSAALHDAIAGAGLPEVASYAVAMAFRVRFYMEMNAREAMHVIELRTAPQGHPAYRQVCQAMHRLIAERAGHRAIAAAMTFADHSATELERLEAERALERRRASRSGA